MLRCACSLCRSSQKRVDWTAGTQRELRERRNLDSGGVVELDAVRNRKRPVDRIIPAHLVDRILPLAAHGAAAEAERAIEATQALKDAMGNLNGDAASFVAEMINDLHTRGYKDFIKNRHQDYIDYQEAQYGKNCRRAELSRIRATERHRVWPEQRLSGISRRAGTQLQYNKYPAIADFRKDLEQIFECSISFNGGDPLSEYTKVARLQLEKVEAFFTARGHTN